MVSQTRRRRLLEVVTAACGEEKRDKREESNANNTQPQTNGHDQFCGRKRVPEGINYFQNYR